MIERLVSSEVIVAKVMADLDLDEQDLKISDIRSWIGEAVEKIGGFNQLVPRVGGIDHTPVLELHGHQAELPCDLHKLHQVAYSISPCGPWLPMRRATGTTNVWGCLCCTSGNCGTCQCCKPEMIIQDSTLVDLTKDIVGNIDDRKALEILNTNQNTKTILRNLINTHTVPSVNGRFRFRHGHGEGGYDLQYNTKPGYIMANMPCGYLRLAYSGIPMDDNGYPMIPDLASYQEAALWYVTMKLMYPRMLRGELDRRDYKDMQTSWNFHRRQAYAELMLPNTQDDMESIKNAWMKLMPEFREHEGFYGTTGERQLIYDQ